MASQPSRNKLLQLLGLTAGQLTNIQALSTAELAVIDGITVGTVTASKAVTVDANKDVSAFRTVGMVNLDAGSSGVAGTVDIFPTTASKGKIALTATANTNDDTLSITNAAQAAARTYTIPDAGANASFVLTSSVGAVQGARCTSAFSATSGGTGDTLTDITGMTVNVLAAGVYAFKAYIKGTSTANSGLKLAIGGTATATSFDCTGGQFNDGTCNDTSTTTTKGNAVAAATTVYNYAFIEGTIVVNAAGTLTVQAAQNAAHADATTVAVNSHFVVTRIA